MNPTQASLFQLGIDVPNKVVLDVEGTEVVWDITGTLPLMLMLNGLGPDDTPTVLRDIVVPMITKDHWPIPVNSSPDTHKISDLHVPLDVLSRFYEETDALGEMRVSMGLLHESVKDNALVITHQPRFQKGGLKKKKMPSPEIRDVIGMNSSLRKKFAFIVLLNKYDIFAMVHERMLIQPAVQEISKFGRHDSHLCHDTAETDGQRGVQDCDPALHVSQIPTHICHPRDHAICGHLWPCPGAPDLPAIWYIVDPISVGRFGACDLRGHPPWARVFHVRKSGE